MAKETVKIDGLKEMEQAFRDLAPAIQGKKGYPQNILRNSARAMANKAKEDARQRAPVKSGRLRDSIDIKLLSLRYRDRATVQGDSREYYYLGHKTGWDRYDDSGAYYGSMVETGYVNQSGKHIPAQPHIRPAVESNKSRLIKIFTDKFSTDITRTVAKVARKNKANDSWKYTGRSGRVR